MYIQDINLNVVDAELFKADILNTYADEALSSENEIETELADLYLQAANTTAPEIYELHSNLIAFRTNNFSASFAGRGIWRKLLAFLCRILNATSTVGDILNAILDFLIANIPGGIIFKGIVKKILKYFLQRGYDTLCPIA